MTAEPLNDLRIRLRAAKTRLSRACERCMANDAGAPAEADAARAEVDAVLALTRGPNLRAHGQSRPASKPRPND